MSLLRSSRARDWGGSEEQWPQWAHGISWIPAGTGQRDKRTRNEDGKAMGALANDSSLPREASLITRQ